MGYVGLVLYVGMMVSALRRAWRAMRLAKQFPGTTGEWVRRYGEMIFIALATFCIGATFLSQMGFEYIYGILLLTVPLLEIAERELAGGGEPHDVLEDMSGLSDATRQRHKRINAPQDAGDRRRAMLPGRGAR